MRRISDTITRLAARRLHLPTNIGSIDRLIDLPAFGSNPGQLKARIYVPETLKAGAPLVVVLHGCTQTAAVYDHGTGWSTLADRHGFALLYPEQQRSNNFNLCFNWYVSDDIGRDDGEALSIRQMVAQMVTDHALDSTRVFVTGLSAGGAMTSVMLATYPEVFAGGAIIAGLPFGGAATLPQALDRMRGVGGPTGSELGALVRCASSHRGPWPTVSVWHGSADHLVVPSNMDAIVDQWRTVHGVPSKPSRTERVDGQSRWIWCDSDGRDCIEAFTIAGMGHGTPIDAGGPDASGVAGAHMLDIGISSAARIIEFWGIGKAPMTENAFSKVAAPNKHAAVLCAEPAARASATSANSGVAKIIDDALRSAGLMR